MSAGGILEKILNALVEDLSPQAAKKIAGFKVDEETQSRVNNLADKSQRGQLTEAESQEYRGLIEAFDLVAILKSKARVALRENS